MKSVIICVFLSAMVFTIVSAAVDPSAQSRQAALNERKARFDTEKKEITGFMNTKNLFKTVVKILFGSSEESAATGRQVLNVLVEVLDMVRNSFGQKARSSSSRGLKDTVDGAAFAGATMLRGYVKSYLAGDDHCAQRHLCESSKEAAREGRELGGVVAQVGGYATSYLLPHQKSIPSSAISEAVRRGRSNEDCAKIYSNCNETL
ncbi:uncharacterized protein LOC128392953 [Panonychus citri]|uniref:uncharacterized protein LOC128392953 n=1 Tax=Panonychus citri TaxID=50023 RepID=UPI002306DD48|nr:uncharacterized protein LOC128392953 [Panonychus citri]